MLTFGWNGEAAWERQSTWNLLKAEMLEGKDNLQFMIPFEWTSSKTHFTESSINEKKKKNNLRIPADHFFPFIIENRNAWLDILNQTFFWIGNLPIFFFFFFLI